MSVYMNPDNVIDFTTDSEYWIYRLINDAKEHPGEITILSLPSEIDANIHVLVPNKYLDVREEQLQFMEETQEWKTN